MTSFVQTDLDALGNVIRSYEYTGYSYDASGRTTGYTRLDRDGRGTILRSYVYSDYTYDKAGRLTGYMQADKDGAGKTLRSYVYLYTYDNAGRRASYTQTDRDADGKTLRSRDYFYDPSGKVLADINIPVDKDKDGNAIPFYVFSDRVYDSLGRLSSFIRSEYDVYRRLVQRLSFAGRVYDPDGRVARDYVVTRVFDPPFVRPVRAWTHYVITTLRQAGFERGAWTLEREKEQLEEWDEMVIFGREEEENTTSKGSEEEKQAGGAEDRKGQRTKRGFIILEDPLLKDGTVSIDVGRSPLDTVVQRVETPLLPALGPITQEQSMVVQPSTRPGADHPGAVLTVLKHEH